MRSPDSLRSRSCPGGKTSAQGQTGSAEVYLKKRGSPASEQQGSAYSGGTVDHASSVYAFCFIEDWRSADDCREQDGGTLGGRAVRPVHSFKGSSHELSGARQRPGGAP